MISSAKAAANPYLFLKHLCAAPWLISLIAMSTLLCGAESTDLCAIIPPCLILVVSSRGDVPSSAFTMTCKGFFFVRSAIISSASLTTFNVVCFFPVSLPDDFLWTLESLMWPVPIKSFANLSTMLIFCFRYFLFPAAPKVCGIARGWRLM